MRGYTRDEHCITLYCLSAFHRKHNNNIDQFVSPALAEEVASTKGKSKRSHFPITEADLSSVFIIHLFNELRGKCTRFVCFFRKYSFFFLLQHLILPSIWQDGAIGEDLIKKKIRNCCSKIVEEWKIVRFRGK